MRHRMTQVALGMCVLALAAGCTQPSARPYVGTWGRGADRAAGPALTIKPTGAFELRIPNPAQPGAGTMKGPGYFHGDTVAFRGATCEPGEARYLLALRDSVLTIAALGADGCALRKTTLAGEWVRR